MKKKILVIPIIATLLLSSTTVYGADYNFNTSYEREQFGKATETDKMPDYSHVENIRRDKNAAYYSPKYGIFSGELPTDQTNPYFELDNNRSAISELTDFGNYNNGVYTTEASEQSLMTSTSILNGGSANSANTSLTTENTTTDTIDYNNLAPKVTINYSEQTYQENYTPIITVEKRSDGSIGTLSIPKLGIKKKVNKGVGIDVMKTAIGHFDFTSQWDGNVAVASHNRGSAAFFSGIWNLNNGDEVLYETSIGLRTYEVFNKEKVDEYDFSHLSSTNENIITMVTCVENQSNLRWVVQAKEKK